MSDYQKLSRQWKDDGDVAVHVDSSGDSNGREHNVEVEEVGVE